MRPSHQTPTVAPRMGRHVAVEGPDSGGFRPVALPALAAAVHVSASAARAARAKATSGQATSGKTRAILHEDDPAL